MWLGNGISTSSLGALHPPSVPASRFEELLAIGGVGLGQQGDLAQVPAHLSLRKPSALSCSTSSGSTVRQKSTLIASKTSSRPLAVAEPEAARKLEQIAPALPPAQRASRNDSTEPENEGPRMDDLRLDRGVLEVGDQLESLAEGVLLDPRLGASRRPGRPRPGCAGLGAAEEEDPGRLLGGFSGPRPAPSRGARRGRSGTRAAGDASGAGSSNWRSRAGWPPAPGPGADRAAAGTSATMKRRS